jgi:uncharacterized protein YbaR (Trm112 family)
MLDRSLIDLLRCPASGTPVAVLDKPLLRAANRLVDTGQLRTVDGRLVETPLETALITIDGATVYPVRDGIPILLLDEAIPADQFADSAAQTAQNDPAADIPADRQSSNAKGERT